jgi:hypothetical protein
MQMKPLYQRYIRLYTCRSNICRSKVISLSQYSRHIQYAFKVLPLAFVQVSLIR